MSRIRRELGAEQPRTAWIEVHLDEAGNWEWRRKRDDDEMRGTEEQSNGNYKSRDAAEEAARAASGNEGLDIYVGPDPEVWPR